VYHLKERSPPSSHRTIASSELDSKALGALAQRPADQRAFSPPGPLPVHLRRRHQFEALAADNFGAHERAAQSTAVGPQLSNLHCTPGEVRPYTIGQYLLEKVDEAFALLDSSLGQLPQPSQQHEHQEELYQAELAEQRQWRARWRDLVLSEREPSNVGLRRLVFHILPPEEGGGEGGVIFFFSDERYPVLPQRLFGAAGLLY
jgi:hypothetical protein